MVPVLWRVGRFALDMAGYTDFITGHVAAEKPTWFSSMILFLLHPPEWVSVLTIVGGFALIGFDVRRRHRAIELSNKQQAKSYSYSNLTGVGDATSQIRKLSTIDETLFPNRLDLNEIAVDRFVLNFMKSMAFREEITLVEFRYGSSKYIKIPGTVLPSYDFAEASGIRHWVLKPAHGSTIENVNIPKEDIKFVVAKLNLAAPLIGVMPNSSLINLPTATLLPLRQPKPPTGT